MCFPSGDQLGKPPSSAGHFGIPPPGGQGGDNRWSPVPSAFTLQIENAPRGGWRTKRMRDPSGDQSGLVSSVPFGGCVSLLRALPSAFITKSSPQYGPFWNRRRSKAMRPFAPGGVAFPIVARTMDARSRTPARSRPRRADVLSVLTAAPPRNSRGRAPERPAHREP